MGSRHQLVSRAAMAAAVPVRDTMAITSLAIPFTLVVVVVNGQIVFPEDERGAVRDCVDGEVCVAKDSCLQYKKKLQQRRDATAQDRPEERAKMVEQLRAMICNKAEKKVCCPVNKGKTGDCSCNGYLHLNRGECGEASSSGCGNWCYVDDSSSCRDARPSSYGAPHSWSCQACRSKAKEEKAVKEEKPSCLWIY